MTLLSPEVIAVLMLDGILFFFASLAFLLSLRIVLRWDERATTPLQYTLQKQAYLVATVIAFIFYLKLPLFLFFIYTLDLLSNILPGAMCAAGVTTATVYGMPLFGLKIANLYLFGLWLAAHRIDMGYPTMPYTRVKFLAYLLLFPLFVAEEALELLHFFGINPHVIVSCCGTLFSAAKSSAVSAFVSLPLPVTLGSFYGLFGLAVWAWRKQRPLLSALANLLFVPVAILSLIAFFSTYVYEMPHHHCPFCLLQADYRFVGYLMYAFLFFGTFFGMAVWLAKRMGYEGWRKWLLFSLIGDFLYVALVSYYPIAFYLKNGVWL